MTIDDQNALQALRRRLSHAEAICFLLTEQDDSVLGEAMRGIRVMLDDSTAALDQLLAPYEGKIGAAS